MRITLSAPPPPSSPSSSSATLAQSAPHTVRASSTDRAAQRAAEVQSSMVSLPGQRGAALLAQRAQAEKRAVDRIRNVQRAAVKSAQAARAALPLAQRDGRRHPMALPSALAHSPSPAPASSAAPVPQSPAPPSALPSAADVPDARKRPRSPHHAAVGTRAKSVKKEKVTDGSARAPAAPAPASTAAAAAAVAAVEQPRVKREPV